MRFQQDLGKLIVGSTVYTICSIKHYLKSGLTRFRLDTALMYVYLMEDFMRIHWGPVEESTLLCLRAWTIVRIQYLWCREDDEDDLRIFRLTQWWIVDRAQWRWGDTASEVESIARTICANWSVWLFIRAIAVSTDCREELSSGNGRS